MITLPTGYLFNTEGSRGQLETLSIGDYGKQHNIKADFLGYTRELNGVPNMPTQPLQEKWVVTLSTQYGCTQKCKFCDVPNVPFNGNAAFEDLKLQLYKALGLFPTVNYTDRLNIHYARMGEPILNKNVFDFSLWMARNKKVIQDETGKRIEVIHPVLTTSMPIFSKLEERILEWCEIKNTWYKGQAGFQFSINSTNDDQRNDMFRGRSLDLVSFSRIAERMPEPLSRKYCLNFAYSTDYEIDAKKLSSMFDKEKFMVKITPIHNNNACRENGIETVGGYENYQAYRKPEEDLKAEGFDVLVFVPSTDEEDGLVTCGNLVLGGGCPKKNAKLNIRGINDQR